MSIVKCFHAFEYTICHTRPSVLLCMARHFNCATIFGDPNHLTRCGIRGKFCLTFTGTGVLPCLLYWPSQHFGQTDAFSCTPLYNTRPLSQVVCKCAPPLWCMYLHGIYCMASNCRLGVWSCGAMRIIRAHSHTSIVPQCWELFAWCIHSSNKNTTCVNIMFHYMGRPIHPRNTKSGCQH